MDDMSAVMVEQAERLFAREVTNERLIAANRGEWQGDLWVAIEAAGLPLALVPEVHGGIGLNIRSVLTLIGRSAWHTLPLPLAETMFAKALWASVADTVPDGAMSLGPTRPGESLSIRRGRGGAFLSGTVSGVPWAEDCDHILLSARDESGGSTLVLLPRGAAEFSTRLNLAHEPRSALTATELPVDDDWVRPAPHMNADGNFLDGALIRSRQMVGAMERALDHAIAYAGERRQFGRTIGKFQAIQQMLAEAAGHLAASEAAAQLASDAFGRAGFAFQVAVGKARVGEAAGKLAEICHQVHGAMGFTQEHPLHFATRRLWAWRDEFGNEAYWQERVGREICAAGGDRLWPKLADD
jgi:acyl-CoA dehydrogenase